MKQTARIISTYAADVSGVASALYELSGMTVLHDASGCNSTYTTHDEPRWYEQDSLVYISALSEMDAVMGNDERLICDIVAAAQELRPAFIAVAGSPIPVMAGTDFKAVAAVIQARTGIPAFGFATSGMHSYLSGASMAFAALAQHMVDVKAAAALKPDTLCVNILGVTPLDFSVNGSAASLAQVLQNGGATVLSTWAMGSTISDIRRAGSANVNLVVSYCGLAAARILQQRFSTPYVVGVPIGAAFTKMLLASLTASAADGICRVAYQNSAVGDTARAVFPAHVAPPIASDVVLIGESVFTCSLAAALSAEGDIAARVLCPLETEPFLLRAQDALAPDEDDIIPLLHDTADGAADGAAGGAGDDTVGDTPATSSATHSTVHTGSPTQTIIADPLYRPICPADATFIPLPHEAFSGRIYRADIPNLIEDFPAFLAAIKL